APAEPRARLRSVALRRVGVHHSIEDLLRARQFVDGQLGTAIGEVRDHRRRAFSAYAVGVGWIIFLFYVFLGAAAFWPQLGVHADASTAAGYVVVFLFMLVPLDG
ncbi:hypothetical protein SB816_30640, partial [Achromobacter sp. SIMBA_011]